MGDSLGHDRADVAGFDLHLQAVEAHLDHPPGEVGAVGQFDPDLPAEQPGPPLLVGFDGDPGWGDPVASEARALGATCGGIRVWSVYVPNGRQVEDPHMAYKLAWLAQLRAQATEWSAAGRPVALMGDWNIAPRDSDVGDPALVPGLSTHISPPEREAFAAFEAAGLADVVRPLVPEGYTYWDYKQLRFPRNEGLRIDFILGSAPFADLVTAASIHRNERKGDAPSDHVPVVVDLDLATEDDDDRPMIF